MGQLDINLSIKGKDKKNGIVAPWRIGTPGKQYWNYKCYEMMALYKIGATVTLCTGMQQLARSRQTADLPMSVPDRVAG